LLQQAHGRNRFRSARAAEKLTLEQADAVLGGNRASILRDAIIDELVQGVRIDRTIAGKNAWNRSSSRAASVPIDSTST